MGQGCSSCFVKEAGGHGSEAFTQLESAPPVKKDESRTVELLAAAPAAENTLDDVVDTLTGPGPMLIPEGARLVPQQAAQQGAQQQPGQQSHTLATVTSTRAHNAEETSDAGLFTGLTLKRYLGKGAFAVVFYGNWLGTEAAIKVVVSSHANAVALTREQHFTHQMTHPHTVQTYLTRSARMSREHVESVYAEHSKFREAARRTRAEAGDKAPDMPSFESEQGFGSPVKKTHPALKHIGEAYTACGIVAGSYVTLVVMEYCDRGTLQEATQKGMFRAGDNWNELIAKRALLRTAAEIAKGLMYLHSKDIVHGDLKPGNVLLLAQRADRRGFRAKLSDFGLCHQLCKGNVSQMTETMGTLAYMSPEHIQGRISKACDMWSMGMVLWQMTTGQAPFSKLTQPQVIMGVMNGSLRPQWPTVDVMPELVDLGRRCMAEDPALRPTAAAVVTELEEVEQQLRRQGKTSLEIALESLSNTRRSSSQPQTPLGTITGDLPNLPESGDPPQPQLQQAAGSKDDDARELVR